MNQNAVYELSDDMFEKLSDSEKNNEFIAVQSKTYFQDAWAHFKKNKLALVSLCFLLVMVALAILVPLLSPYTYDGQDLTLRNDPPSLSHPLGTDKFGRDIFVRLMYGARISLSVGFAAAFIPIAESVLWMSFIPSPAHPYEPKTRYGILLLFTRSNEVTASHICTGAFLFIV